MTARTQKKPETFLRAKPGKDLRRSFIRGVAHHVAPLLAVAALTACSQNKISFLDPQGPVADAQRGHFFYVIWLVLIVVMPVILLTPIVAWHYRHGNRKARYTPEWGFSWPLEIAIWGVPLAIFGALAWPLWTSSHALDPYKPLGGGDPVRVQVIGYDWKWLFIYPDEGIASIGELAFPTGRPLAFQITSDTVMQSFFIPALGSQIYAMNHMVTRLNLEAKSPGRFLGENTQYNGEGFHRQKFDARAVAPEAWDHWVGHVRTDGIALDANSYAALAKPGTLQDLARDLGLDPTSTESITFRGVPPGMFGSIVARKPGRPPDGLAGAGRNGTDAPSLQLGKKDKREATGAAKP